MEQIANKLLKLLPYWHFNVERRIKQKNDLNITYEGYYCLLGLTQVPSMTMTDIATDFYFGKQQTTRIISQLVSHGLVEKTVSPLDKRITNVSISEKGMSYLKRNPFDTTDLGEDLNEKLTKEEMEELNHALDVLLKIFQK
ncbi:MULTISPECIES: MarR family winged helix-turn-helix transcriptional regulator [Vagococcus]|uniref:MarR family winged helix-turn-helix transcriptional regulator n=1 Tax=Vagococcus TaxID=2737 RepID=UPI000E53F7D7|nr:MULTISPECIES: MarR family transcriptional regulator [Vagococcus]RHH71040.1 MarR family transcriptional regulator [Vagococcus sp. AM17-17]